MFFLGQFCRTELKSILDILEAKVGLKSDIVDNICIMLVSNSIEISNAIAIDAYIESRK